jgi:uncharacterized membrane protein YgcG
MRPEGIFPVLFIGCILLAGCTQLSGTPPGSAAVPPPAITGSVPSPAGLPVATESPQLTGTVVHYISQVRDVKDSDLWFSLQVPVEWNITTRRLPNPENFEGSLYQTDLVGNNTFFLHTFTNYRSRDQNYRDDARQMVPAPAMTTVTINGIVFDRFESAADGRVNVTYVARQAGMNEHGYLSVLAFTANTSNRFEKEDFERVVSSFRYYGRDAIDTMPGEEIPRIAPPASEGGGVRSAVGGGSSGSSGGGGGGGGCGCGGG